MKLKIYLLLFLFASKVFSQVTENLDSLLARCEYMLATNNTNRTLLLNYATKAAQIAEKQENWDKLAAAYLYIGEYYGKKGQEDQLYKYLFQAVEYFKKVKNYKEASKIYRLVGGYEMDKENYTKTRNYYQEAYHLALQVGDSTEVFYILADKALLLIYLDSLEKAENTYSDLEKTFKNYDNAGDKATRWHNLALGYYNRADYNKALLWLKKSAHLKREIFDKKLYKDSKDSLLNLYRLTSSILGMGKIHRKMNEWETSNQYLLEGAKIAEKANFNDLLDDVYNLLGSNYAKLGKYEQGFEALRKHIILKDSIFGIEVRKNQEAIEGKYQNEKKQQQIKELELKNQVQQRNQILFLLGIVALLIILGLLYRNFRSKQKANQKLAEINEKLSSLNEELKTINDRLDEANEAKTKLFGIISHDLRKPIGDLFQFLQIQKNSPQALSKADKQNIEKHIQHSAENLLEIMEDILIWSKTQMEQFSLAYEQVDLQDLLNEIVLLYENSILEKNIVVEKLLAKPFSIQTDANILKIILRNLFGNALKYTPINGKITFSAQNTAKGYEIIIADNGKGMSSSQIAELMQWNTLKSGNSGLGLRLCKEFTEMLNGKMFIQSTENEGTKMILFFSQ
jgi:signal transduction histidine kinase/tetratricopeptide (TPR) repeat protein